MISINGKTFHSIPYMCGECPFFLGNGKLQGMKESTKGICIQFDKRKNLYDSLPKRCAQLFEKAFTYPDGTNLVIVLKDE